MLYTLSRITVSLALLSFPALLAAQEKVVIRVEAGGGRGAFKPVWAYFGYDEPNFTYMEYGKKLLGELSALSPAPVYIRAHNLLTSGDGKPALKWGSTNAYTEDASGRPVYDWTLLDRIFDAYRAAKVKPLVEIGFMPEALSTHPQPYQHDWPKGKLSTGWAYPPKDYGKWAELVYRWVRHSMDRYGKPEVQSWYWEVWNEPDISYWQGTPEEYYRLYDYATDAIKRALPEARVGGPHSTGPQSPKAAEFLRRFLEHCARGTNYATGRKGAPLDYIAFHPKGSPRLVDGRLRMGIARQLQSVAKGFEIVASFPEFRKTPVILGESDPEGCAACSARVYPQNAYRNGALYPCYTAAVFARILELADQYGTHLEGVVTWAFEFEDQPYFDGFRTLATNGIDKPVLNVFRMFGLMAGERLPVESTQAVPLDSILESGVSGPPDLNAIATGEPRKLSVLLWNYHDEDVPSPDAMVSLVIEGVPRAARRVLVHHYRIDEQHSNAYTVWKGMGSPQNPTPEQYARLEAAGRLEQLGPPQRVSPKAGTLELNFPLPRQGTSLVQLSW
jgi:xylan 1,4-beta-xylosidase